MILFIFILLTFILNLHFVCVRNLIPVTHFFGKNVICTPDLARFQDFVFKYRLHIHFKIIFF